MLFAAVHESGFGTFRTWRDVRLESVNRLKADMISAEKFQKWFELPKADLAALAAKAKGKWPSLHQRNVGRSPNGKWSRPKVIRCMAKSSERRLKLGYFLPRRLNRPKRLKR